MVAVSKGIRGVEEGEVGGLEGTREEGEGGIYDHISRQVVDERARGGKGTSWRQSSDLIKVVIRHGIWGGKIGMGALHHQVVLDQAQYATCCGPLSAQIVLSVRPVVSHAHPYCPYPTTTSSLRLRSPLQPPLVPGSLHASLPHPFITPLPLLALAPIA